MRFFSRLSTPEIAIDELDTLIQSGSVRVLDVREDWEFRRGRVPGAVNVPLKKLPLRAPQLKHDKPYAVICESGSRSRGATNFLLDHRLNETHSRRANAKIAALALLRK